MDLGLRGRTALVTASGRGIGAACARALAAEGVRVAVCARSASDVDAVLEEMGGADAGHAAFIADLVAEGSPTAVAQDVLERFGSLDIVVHNLGGTLAVRDPFASERDWQAVLRLNLTVAIEMNAVLVPPMRERGWGRVVAISSVAGEEHSGALPYGVAKAALGAYVRGLGRELAPTGVVVSAVVPGTVLTEGGVWDLRQRSDPEAVERYIHERLPAGRFQTPASIADTVTFLCSDRAGEFCGSVLTVDGGQGRAFSR